MMPKRSAPPATGKIAETVSEKYPLMMKPIDDPTTTPKIPLEAALPENRVKPLQPYDERLGGDQEELEKLQQG